MKFHLICQKESANVEKLLDYKKRELGDVTGSLK